MVSERSYKEERLPFDILAKMKANEYTGLDEKLTIVFVNNMVRHFRKRKVMMSDGKIGIVAYIPPNDINHPVILTHGIAKQVNREWYCKKVLEE